MPPGMHAPESVRIDLPRGDWVLVKKRLTAGEMRRSFALMVREESGSVDPLMVGVNKVLTYLVDWSVTDMHDRPLVIRDQPPDRVLAILDALDHDCYQEVKDAVDAHEAAMTREREAEKKRIRDGGTRSSATSESPVSSAGVTTG